MRPWAALLLLAAAMAQAEPLVVGSKRFTESYILGELIVQTARAAGAEVEFRPGMGGTAILYEALRTGAIDLYPEYTGTIAREILQGEARASLESLNARLAPLGLAAAVPLGFNNTYAIGVRREVAEKRRLRRISDLAGQRQLRLGFGHEFLGRRDGWPGLAAAYGLAQRPRGLDHGLAYEALAAGEVDVIDLYSTDAKIARYAIAVLEDDRGFFPVYDAVLLHRADVPQRFPRAWHALAALEGSIEAERMRRMNAAAELEGRSFAEAARLHRGAAPGSAPARGFLDVLLGPDLWRLTREHLLLVFASLAASVAAGVPLGVAAARWARAAQPILGAVGVIQTIPSLALFAFLIALTGAIGTWPALVALFLYALLPIVRNTHAGLAGADERGDGRGADNVMLLAGAIPAAVLALIVQGAFELAERRFTWMARARAAS